MSVLYAPRKAGPSEQLAAGGLGTLCALSVFALLPLLSTLPDWIVGPPLKPITVADDPPPVIPIEKPEAAPEPEPLDKPELPKILPPVSLEIMEILINAGDNGAGMAVDWGNALATGDTDVGVFLESEVDQRPRVLVAVKPLYPYSMRTVPAEVIVEFIIGADGKVRRPVARQSTHFAFERAAIDAIVKSKWQPGLIKGSPVDTLVRIPVRFTP